MATSRLLSRPPAGRVAQRSWWRSSPSYAYKCAPKASRKDDSQASSLESKDQNLNRDTRFARANTGNRNTSFAGKVATRVGVSQGFDSWDDVVGFVSSFALTTANWKLNPSQTQGLIERVIVDCRFFTFLAVAGSLLGSILCFVEGFIMVLRCYFRNFEAVLHKLDHGDTVELLVEAIDMFLVGTAMLIFGMGLYVMFVGPKHPNHQRQPRNLSKSSMFSLFSLEMLPSCLKMESVSEAKTRIGHAVLMILQVGMLDKFKSVPLVSGSDLASFAAALLLSSASIFCLSKLSRSEAQQG